MRAMEKNKTLYIVTITHTFEVLASSVSEVEDIANEVDYLVDTPFVQTIREASESDIKALAASSPSPDDKPKAILPWDEIPSLSDLARKKGEA